MQPISLASIIVNIRVVQTVKATSIGIRSIIISLMKLHNARVIEHNKATRDSFHITLKISLNSISFKDNARITLTLDWLPAFPPVSISIGMMAVRIVYAFNSSSKLSIILPVKVAEIIKSSNQGILAL